jgi:hypothetical protein
MRGATIGATTRKARTTRMITTWTMTKVMMTTEREGWGVGKSAWSRECTCVRSCSNTSAGSDSTVHKAQQPYARRAISTSAALQTKS